MKLSARYPIIILFFLFSAAAFAQHPCDNRLWYDAPAKIWLEALPIGNSKMGGMVYGGIDTEELQLNEETFWSGGPHNNNSTKSLGKLKEVRNLIFNGKEKEAENMINADFVKGPHGMRYLTLGSLKISNIRSIEKNATDYHREIDLERGISTVSFTAGGHKYMRTAFASLSDSIIVVHLSCDTTMNLKLNYECTFTPAMSYGTNHMTATIKGDGQEGISGALTAKCKVEVEADGTVAKSTSCLYVRNSHEVTLYICASTNFVC